MKSMNKVQLIGWLGADPVTKLSRHGDPFGFFRMATDHWRDDAHQPPIKYTVWHDVYLWQEGHRCHATNYLLKGSHVMVEGILVYRQYNDRNGCLCRMASIRATNLIDLDR